MAAPTKIQLFGHSFVSRLKRFIADDTTLRFDLGLQGVPLVQYSGYPGATAIGLKEKLDVVSDFSPDILVLLVGTNDLCNADLSVEGVTENILDIVDYAIHFLCVPRVLVCQVLHRCSPGVRIRYPVDIPWFNTRVDRLNITMDSALRSRYPDRAFLWRLKGFWSEESKRKNFCVDGCHLSNNGQFRLLSDIRAAVVAAIRSTVK